MKKKLVVAIFLGILLLGGLAVLRPSAPKTQNGSVSGAPQDFLKSLSRRANQSQGPTNSKKSNNNQAAIREKIEKQEAQIKETYKNLNERKDNLAKMAKLFTPEQQGKMVDMLMVKIEESLKPQLKSWDLDDQLIEEVFSTLKERESSLAKHRIEFMKDGKSDQFQIERASTNSLADLQLEKLLGKIRATELSRLEAQVRTASGPNRPTDPIPD